jgi:hypothetical protein
MTFKSGCAIAALQSLERYTSSLRDCAEALSEASGKGDLATAIAATRGTRDALNAIATTTIRLKRQIVPADGLGEDLESLGELMIRSIRIVLIEEMRRLRSTVHDLTTHGQLPWPIAEWSHGIDDVALFVHDEMNRITNMWMPDRSGAKSNRAFYRTRVRIAQYTIREMGSQVEFAHFLEVGAGLAEWPGISRACTLMISTTLLDIDADTDADCRLFASCPPWSQPQRPSDGAPAGER